MSKARVAPRPDDPKVLTLADVVIAWEVGAETKRVAGADVPVLLAIAERLYGDSWPTRIAKADDIACDLNIVTEFLSHVIGEGGELEGAGLTAVERMIAVAAARIEPRFGADRYAVVVTR